MSKMNKPKIYIYNEIFITKHRSKLIQYNSSSRMSFRFRSAPSYNQIEKGNNDDNVHRCI